MRSSKGSHGPTNSLDADVNHDFTLEVTLEELIGQLTSVQRDIDSRFNRLDQALTAIIKHELKLTDVTLDLDDLKNAMLETQNNITKLQQAHLEYQISQGIAINRVMIAVLGAIASAIGVPLILKLIGV